jgi:hypothetical protein
MSEHHTMSYDEAEKLMLRKDASQAKFLHFKVKVLENLCAIYRLEVTGSGHRGNQIKEDYIKAILAYRDAAFVKDRARSANPANIQKFYLPDHSHSVQIRLYDNAKGWQPRHEVNFGLNQEGNLDLHMLQVYFDTDKKCRVSVCSQLSIRVNSPVGH